jgi:hypothetical protein
VAKSTGLGQNLYVGGVDLSGDTGSIDTIHGGPAALDLTGIDKSGHERAGGLYDGELGWTSFFDVVAGQEHPTLSPLPTTDVGLMYVTQLALGGPAGCLVAKQMNYDPTRGSDGSLLFKLQALSNSGVNTALEWAQMLTVGKKTDTAATNGTGVDYGAVSTLFGATGWLHVFSVVGTSITVKIQDSADNITFADVTGLTFAAVAPGGAPQYQRLQTATGATIRRYVRAISTGTFSNAVFACAFTRHLTATI